MSAEKRSGKAVKYYYIASHLNGYVLEVAGGSTDDGASVITYPKNSHPTDHQLWRLDYQPDRSFLIVSKLNDKVMDTASRGKSRKDAVVVYGRSGHESQRWRREGCFIVSVLTGEALDVENNSCTAAARIITWPCKWFRSTNQQFDLEEASTTKKRYFYIRSRLNGHVLDVEGACKDNCVQVINYPQKSSPSDNQLWYLDFQSNGSFLIVSKLHRKVLSIKNVRGGNGGPIVVADYDSLESQQWKRKGSFIVSVWDGSVLGVEGGSTAPGAVVVSCPPKSPAPQNQQFEFEEVFKLRSDSGTVSSSQTSVSGLQDPLQFQIPDSGHHCGPPPPYSALPQTPDGCHPPQGYSIMDAFRSSNIIQLVACSNKYPLQISEGAVCGNGSFSDPKTHFEVVVPQSPPDVIMLKSVCGSENFISVQNGMLTCLDQPGPSCHLLVHVILDNFVFLESNTRRGQSLSVSGNGVSCLSNFGEDDTQFAVRIVVQKYPPSAIITTPFGWPSIANRIRDKCVVQLYVRQDHSYVSISDEGNVITVTNGQSENTLFEVCDRGVCIYSLIAHKRPNFQLRVVDGATVGQGDPNFLSDFYLKERSNGDVSFESVFLVGTYVSVQSADKSPVTSFSMLFWDAKRVGSTEAAAEK